MFFILFIVGWGGNAHGFVSIMISQRGQTPLNPDKCMSQWAFYKEASYKIFGFAEFFIVEMSMQEVNSAC